MRLRTVLSAGVALLLIAGCDGPTRPLPLPLPDEGPIPPSAPSEPHATLEVVSASVTTQTYSGGTDYSLATLQLKETSGAMDAAIGSITLESDRNSASTNLCWQSPVVVPAGTTVDVARLLVYCDVSFWTVNPVSLLRISVTYGGGLYLYTYVAPTPAE